MIKNERQLRLAVSKVRALEISRSMVSDKAGWAAYTDLIDDVAADIAEYEDVKDGRVREFKVDGLDALGPAIVKARISQGWTQQQFAAQLEVSEQQVQKDEARDYEHAGLARLAETLDVLGFELVGTVKRRGEFVPGGAEDGRSMSTSTFSAWKRQVVEGFASHALNADDVRTSGRFLISPWGDVTVEDLRKPTAEEEATRAN